MNTSYRALAALSIGLLAGCYTVTPMPQEAPAPAPVNTTPQAQPPERIIETRPPSDADLLLEYYASTVALTREQQVRELERIRRQYETSGGNYTRMQLILARVAANGEPKEHEKTLELLQLQMSSKDDISPGSRALTLMLRQLLGDNRQLEGNFEAQREKLKDETKKSEALRQKLEALVEAERKLQERNRPK